MSETSSVSTLRTVGEHVELDVGDDIAQSPRYNEDIAPTLLDKHFLRKHGANAYYGQNEQGSEV